MKQVVSNVRRSSRVRGLVLVASSLLLTAVLTTAASAAAPGAGTAGLSVNVQQAVTPVLSGIVIPGRVTIPARPTPRSPFQPPSWVPTPPPWVPGPPPSVPARPSWVRR